MQPIPAIDIRGGRCVRLRQGDFQQETIYGDDPAEMARRWEAQGAPRLHVVDLDGARDGRRGNAASIERLIGAVSIPVQVGGGIRALETAKEVLETGADRVVVGTAAAENLDDIEAWVQELTSARLIVSVDARGGMVATRGWLETTGTDAAAFCGSLVKAGVLRILYTDIGRDGTLSGPNLQALSSVAAIDGLRLLASGGISSLEDLKAVAATGAEGVIIGKALYDNTLRLSEVIATLSQETAC